MGLVKVAVLMLIGALFSQVDGRVRGHIDHRDEGGDIVLSPDQAAALNSTASPLDEPLKYDHIVERDVDSDHSSEGSDIVLTPEQVAALNQTSGSARDEKVEEFDDLLLTREQLAAITSRKGISSVTFHWPDVDGFPHVPYTFADDLVNRTAVRAAIQHWRDHTCITFTEVPDNPTRPRIRFKRHATACNSYVGRINSAGGQIINVPVWCENVFGSLVHEIGHAIGFWHEHSRSDRASSVEILEHNVKSAAIGNFALISDNDWGVPYDYYSDMHYNGQGFSKNGKNTIVTLDPRYQSVIGQRYGLSHMDKLLANTMYGCTNKLLEVCSLSSDPCQNYGYLGTSCDCVCPEGTSGDYCQTLDTPYSDVHVPPYTEKITSPQTISTVNYPNSFPASSDFTKWIVAPECKRIQLLFTDFDIYGETTMMIDGVSTTACFNDALEIRTTNMNEGEWYCGRSITSGQVFTSTGNQMILYFKAATSFKKGWRAEITFIDTPSCATSPSPTKTTNSISTKLVTVTSTSTSTMSATNTFASSSTTNTLSSSTATSAMTTSASTSTSSATTTSASTATPSATTTSVSTSTSPETATSTSTSPQTATSTSTSPQTATSTSASPQTATSTSTSPQTATSTSTSPQTATSTSTSPQTATSTSTSPQTATSTSTSPQTATSTSTSPQTATLTSSATTSATTRSTTTTSTTTSRATTTTSTSIIPTSTTSTTSATTTAFTETTTNTEDLCQQYTQNGVVYYTSPNFPQFYPSNAVCTLSNLTDNLGVVYFHLEMFRLGSGDVFEIQNPYTMPLRWTGVMPRRTYLVPSAQFLATFTSNDRIQETGFKMRIYTRTTSCHQILSADPGGVVASPNYPFFHRPDTYCEWHITASPGRRVRISFTRMTVGWRNLLYVNPTSNPFYAPETGLQLRGYARPPPITSESNLMRIFYYGGGFSWGFRLIFNEV